MIDSLDTLALAACAKGMAATTTPEQADHMRRMIVSTLAPTWQPAPSLEGGRPRSPFHVLVRNAVRNAGFRSNARKARWEHVVDALAVGSTFANELCAWAGVDPDELVGSWRQ